MANRYRTAVAEGSCLWAEPILKVVTDDDDEVRVVRTPYRKDQVSPRGIGVDFNLDKEVSTRTAMLRRFVNLNRAVLQAAEDQLPENCETASTIWLGCVGSWLTALLERLDQGDLK